MRVRVHVCVRMRVHVCVRFGLCLCVFVCVCICVCVCLCVTAALTAKGAVANDHQGIGIANDRQSIGSGSDNSTSGNSTSDKFFTILRRAGREHPRLLGRRRPTESQNHIIKTATLATLSWCHQDRGKK